MHGKTIFPKNPKLQKFQIRPMRLYAGYYGSTETGNEIIFNIRPFNTHNIYTTYNASLNKQMIQLCEKVYQGHLAFPAIAIFFNHRLQLLQLNTNSISFIRKGKEHIQKLDCIIVECLKIENILEINFFKSTYPGFFFKGLKKLFELSGFSSYPGSSYPVYFNRKHIALFKGPENLFELGEVRVIRIRVIRFPLY